MILLAIVSMIVPLSLQAQEDVTATYLVNPSFEEGVTYFHDVTQKIPGWNIDSLSLAVSYRNDDADATKDGTFIFGIWDPANISDFQISQTVKGLPAGTYVISCLMTVPDGNNTTQRLFATTNSAGTKAMYFAATSLGVVPGESYEYKGNAVDGNGAGPFHPMSLTINVSTGDSLVFGVRTNGQKSTILPLSTVGGAGWFKFDNFKLGFIADPNAFVKDQIQTQINVIKAVAIDSIPGGYSSVIDAKIIEAQGVVSNQTIGDSLTAYNLRLKTFVAQLKEAKTKFLSLQTLLMKAENLNNTTNFPNKLVFTAAFDDMYAVYFASTSLLADFNAAYVTLDAAIHAYIDGVMPENLALIGTPSTSYVSGWEKLAAVNDGFEPTGSGDRSHPVYGNWNGDADYGKTNWIQYEWAKFNKMTSVSIYWFSDGGGLLQPTTANIEYWKDGAWVVIDTISTVLDQWNTLSFDTIKSQKLRANFSSTTSTGIIEFKVNGLRKVVEDMDDYKIMINDELKSLEAYKDTFPKGYLAPVATLKQNGTTLLTSGTLETMKAFVAESKSYRLQLDTARMAYDNLVTKMVSAKVWIDSTSLPNKDKLVLAYNNANTVFTSTSSFIAEFNANVEILQNAINAYSLLSSRATATTSYVAGWDRLSALNDGFDPKNSTDTSHRRYGNWNGEANYGKANWVMYEWAAMATIKSISVYWSADGGGLMLPDSTGVEYFDGAEWKSLGPIGFEGDKYNTINTDIMATKLKLTMRSVAATSIIELKVVGFDAPVAIAEVNQSNSVNVYPTMVKRGAAINVQFAKELAKPVALEIFSISGQKMYNTTVSGKASSINVPSSLGSGLYLMVVNTPEGKLFKKIVVE